MNNICNEVGIYYNLLEFYNSPKYERHIEKWSYRILNALVRFPEVQNNDDIYTNVLLINIAFLRKCFKKKIQPTKKIENLTNQEKKIALNLLKSCIL